MKNIKSGSQSSNESSDLTRKNNLKAPNSYWNTPSHLIEAITNGCGYQGITSVMVPDQLLGTSITKACNIHDYMYSRGETSEGRKIADKIFLGNMISLIDESKSSLVVKSLRKMKAYVYYIAVRILGGSSYNVEPATNSIVMEER